MSITLGSLFDGIGGFPLAAQRVGITPVWASEIEPFPLRVTALRFPDMAQLGDISQLKGTDVHPVDIVSGGSPCQDLSIAGARAGLAGERSGLFLEQIRLIRAFPKFTSRDHNDIVTMLKAEFHVRTAEIRSSVPHVSACVEKLKCSRIHKKS